MAALAAALGRETKPSRLGRLARLIAARTTRFRRGVLLREHAGLLPVSEVFARTDALRWLGQVADHAARPSRHAEEAKHIDGPAGPARAAFSLYTPPGSGNERA